MFDAREIEEKLALDFERYSAEYMCRWRDDLVAFIDAQLIESAVDAGVMMRPPQPRCHYFAFADPSGGRVDSFTCAIAHSENDVAYLDALYERRSPFNPSIATAEVARFLEGYGLSSVTGDHYAAEWVVDAFLKEGIRYTASERNRSEIYLDVIPMFTAGRVRLIDNDRLVHQFTGLERRTSPLGKDRIDHPQNAHDDCCNAVAGALLASAHDPLDEWRRLAD
jgi:hypothetical protein